MKKTILAAVALVALASCAKENTAVELIDPTAPVAATFTSAAITRVANNAWQTGDQIGITMVKNKDTALATGSYENVPYTVDAAGASGTFTPTAVEEGVPVTIYFPVDGTEVVDFIAYYPYLIADDDKNIPVSVADQKYAHIDLVAAKAVGKTKASSTVTFANDKDNEIYEAFEHQLSKLSLTIKVSDGIDDLDDLVSTIKGQYTTAKFNIYSFGISGLGGSITNIEMVDPTYNNDKTEAYTSAILIPTDAVSDSTIEFKVGGNTYFLDTSEIAFDKGKEYNYEITLKRTGATITGATINNWGDGAEGTTDELTASDYVAATYAVGDLYPNESSPIGVVYEISNGGANGKIVALDNEGTGIQWSTERVTIGLTDADNGRNNMVTILSYTSYTADTYPTVALVHAKNTGATAETYTADATGVWYLPARNELTTLSEVVTEVNSALTTASGTAFLDSTWCWSSTEYDGNSISSINFFTGTFSESYKTNIDSSTVVRAILAF